MRKQRAAATGAAALCGFLGETSSCGLAEALLEVGADGLDELGAVNGLSLNTLRHLSTPKVVMIRASRLL